MKKRGQIGIEYLIVAGFVTFIVITILTIALFFSNSIEDRLVALQVENFAEELIGSSESVFFAGEPSEIEISAYLPKNVQDIQIVNGSELLIVTESSSGINRRVFISKVPLSGSIDSAEGTKIISLSAGASEVSIVQVGGSTSPSGPYCGNNINETGEVCDGVDLAGQSCSTQGYAGGILGCNPDCLGFDVSGCV